VKSRIGELVCFLSRAKARGAKLNGKSAFEKELAALINAPETKVDISYPKNAFEIDSERILAQTLINES
jgi:hypothetical protein